MWHFQAQGDCKNVSKQIALLPNGGPAELFCAREHEVSLQCRQLFTTLGSVTLIQSVCLTCRILCVRCTYQNCRSGCKNKNYSLFGCVKKDIYIGLKGWPGNLKQILFKVWHGHIAAGLSQIPGNQTIACMCVYIYIYIYIYDTWHRHKICC